MNLHTVRAKSAEESNSNTFRLSVFSDGYREKARSNTRIITNFGMQEPLDRMLSLSAFGISDDEAHHDQKLKKNAHLVTK